MSKTEKDVVVVSPEEMQKKLARILGERDVEVRDAGDGTYEVRTKQPTILPRGLDPLAWGGMVMMALRDGADLVGLRRERCDEHYGTSEYLVAVVRPPKVLKPLK